MSQLHRSTNGRHKVIAVSVFCMYLVIACGVNLFHTEDCPLTTGKTAPSSESCPACKFLAGANATEVLYDSGPAVMECRAVAAPTPDSFGTVSAPCLGSIIVLRGPPLESLS